MIKKYLEVSVEAELRNRNATIKKTLEAKIDNGDFTFHAISDFQKDIKKINAYIKKLTHDGTYFKMTICVGEYDDSDWDETFQLQQKSFNFWEFSGFNDCPEDEKEMGVYLSPDTRYTEECFDIWYDFTLDSLPNV